VIPENLPDYIDRGGRQVWRPPYTARETDVFGFLVPCDRGAIDRVLRRDLVEPSRGAVDYRCAHDHVAVLFARIGQLASADYRDSQRGFVSEREVSVWCLAADVLAGGRLVWYLPYVFVDSGQAAASGREVYGYPKQMGVFADPYPESLATPGTTTVQAQAIDPYGPTEEAVLRPMISATAAAGAGVIAGDPADAFDALREHLIERLGVDTTLPFGAAPRPSAAITPVDAPPPRAAQQKTPAAWAARRVLDTLLGRDLAFAASELVIEMMASPMLVFLKQFRDVACPTKACYQAVVEAPLAVHMLGAKFHPLDAAAYQIAFSDYASHPIATELGVTPGQPLTPQIAFRAQFNFDIELGSEVWRALT
jgi:hypothetical protein